MRCSEGDDDVAGCARLGYGAIYRRDDDKKAEGLCDLPGFLRVGEIPRLTPGEIREV
jgi:hypothetical protein